ncbi:MAG: aminopeptidase N [Gammaproteobacteria bacterium]|nr:aminopeptidase N [Gammaproteobacteria bacterium]
MKTEQQQRRYLNEYRASDFEINQTHLIFDLAEKLTRVKSQLEIRRQCDDENAPLKLDGVGLELISVSIDGKALSAGQYQLDAEQMIIPHVPDVFLFECEVFINPAANTRLEGLYLSAGNYCTQCEAEGFRLITYYIDRPDVMSVFSTRISGDKSNLPVLLSNGNRVDSGVNGDQHWVEWRDPFPKPAYLFALVAGDLACVEGEFTTVSGRKIDLQFYTEYHNRDKCDYAMQSLQKAMRWDEEVYGLEYDLDLYMVVAVDDFNMGAMENKGLNVFNSKYVLANPQIATDNDFLAIEAVVGHEYFHNWTGNRVTCRDWFQLSLKEGLTVFRDQEFSADMASRAIQRIADVRVLRNHQFPEDAGPMAHPVRPVSYQEINNFYTATVYNKGAEVVRMIHTLLGKGCFRKGMDLYFQRHDGQAVTTDDFRLAMQDASGIDLSQFQRWYEQSDTPQINITRSYCSATQQFELLIQQHAGNTKGKPNLPFHMPMRLSLFDQQGEPVALDANKNLELTFDINAAEQKLCFEGVEANTMVSAFRGFSAPIKLTTDMSDHELSLLMSCDSDPFNQWEASQQFASRVMLEMVASSSEAPHLYAGLVDACGKVLSNTQIDLSLMAEMLILPGEKYLGELLDQVDVHRVRRVRETVRQALAVEHEEMFLRHYQACNEPDEYRITPQHIARRRLKNTSLSYLLMLQKSDYFELCRQQFEAAHNMTDQMGCLLPIVDYRHEVRDQIVTDFYQQWQDSALVVDKWFSAQASSYAADSFQSIIALFDHAAYTLHNPNRARSLLGALIGNSSAFHQVDGAGYNFVAERIIELDAINPQVAARMGSVFIHWKKLIPQQGELMKQQIEKMIEGSGVSNDLYELLTTSLQD